MESTSNKNKITSFKGKFDFLSNFYLTPININNKEWWSVEHIYQAAKTINKEEREKIRLMESPSNVKYYARSINLRKDWDFIKQNIMLKAVRLKFNNDIYLKNRLIETKNKELIEENKWHDNTWGDCKCSKCKHKNGHNLLGRILMLVREEVYESSV